MVHSQALNFGDILMTFFAFLFLIIAITVFIFFVRYFKNRKGQLDRNEEKINVILDQMHNEN